jgi:glucokinase
MPKKHNAERWIGFDLGGTKMLAEVFDGNFKKLGMKRRKSRGAPTETETLAQRIAATIDGALANAGCDRSALCGIGVGAPGPLDIEQGVLLESVNSDWGRVALKAELEKDFKRPVFLANDVDIGLYGEYRFGAATGAHCAVGLFPGTGIGGGCVYEGRIFRGKTRSCMEIGHYQVQPDGPLCGCGQRGCLEAVASRLAVSAAAAVAALRGEAPFLLAAQGTDLKEIRSKALADAIRGGDQVVEKIVREAARWLGVGIATAVTLLAPDVVVLGGGMVEAMPDIFRKESEKTARSRVMDSVRDTFRVEVALLGDSAATLGAAAWAKTALQMNSYH